MVENDTLLAQQEIVKLLTYVDRQRPVEAEDVERLCSGASGNVFEMVDAIGKKDRHKALRQLHILLEKNEAQGLFFMTVRQFRLLLQVREAMDDGGSLESGTSEFKRSLPLDRLRSQAQRFSMPQLERIYHQLFEMDKAIKSGKLTPELALDMLIAQID